MGMKEDVIELKKELEKVKKDGVFFEDGEIPLATEVVKLLKSSVRRLYILLIILLVMLVISVIDSFYQRHIIIGILENMDVVEEVVTEEIIEDYDITQESGDNGNNNFITGDNNEVNN